MHSYGYPLIDNVTLSIGATAMFHAAHLCAAYAGLSTHAALVVTRSEWGQLVSNGGTKSASSSDYAHASNFSEATN
jgi:hypothetical protein